MNGDDDSEDDGRHKEVYQFYHTCLTVKSNFLNVVENHRVLR